MPTSSASEIGALKKAAPNLRGEVYRTGVRHRGIRKVRPRSFLPRSLVDVL
jgi:hypothetical protein